MIIAMPYYYFLVLAIIMINIFSFSYPVFTTPLATWHPDGTRWVVLTTLDLLFQIPKTGPRTTPELKLMCSCSRRAIVLRFGSAQLMFVREISFANP